MIKRFRGSALGRLVLSHLGAATMRLVWHSTRWSVEGLEHRNAVLAGGGPVVTAFWHGRLFFSPFLAPPGRETVAMISNNSDGALISAIVARFNVGAVRGSTRDPRKRERDKGGREAYDAALAALGRNAVLAITPDGPRGPLMRAQGGAALLSIAAQAPVLPWSISTRHARFTRSWDRFLIPRPFDRGLLIYGPPIQPPAAADEDAVERHRLAIETAVTAVTQEADRRMGHPPLTPA
jgi:lysophospholipid acyltransferase (LPLAT)-like uncharacterized protein